MSLSGVRVFSATFFAVIILAVPLSAQVTGSIHGLVVDPAGAVVPQGTVTLRNLETGAVRTTQELSDGAFSFDLLQIGNYQVRVEAPGFRSALTDVDVRTGEVSSVRMAMQVGAITESITVRDAVTPLDSENSQIQTSYRGIRVQELPVARNPNLFAISVPGTAPVSVNNPFLGSGSFNANGMRGRGNNIVVDGITATDVSTTGTGGAITSLNFSSIREVKVITNNFNAEYGRNNGAQVLYQTVGGTNRLHGEAYEYFRNNVLNARSFFDTSGKANLTRRNQYGFAVGGPFKVPGYDGSNRSFWHADWEQVKLRGSSAPVVARVPTPAMIAQVTDPTSLALLNQYKIPVAASGSINNQAGASTDTTLFSIRADQNFGTRDVIWGRFARSVNTTASASLTFIGTNLNGFGATSGGPTQQASFGHTHTFGPTAVNEFRFGFAESLAANFPINTPYPLGPRIQFDNAEVDRFGLSDVLPQGREQRTFQYSDNFSLIRGSHALKFGGEWFYLQADSFFDSLQRGLYSFATWTDFAAGRPRTMSQRFGNSTRQNRVNNFFTFAQDDWKVNRNLTLNLGVRMEWAGGPTEKNGTISNLNFANQAPYGAAGGGPFGIFELGKPSFSSNKNWAPRVGFAWAADNQKTVIRGGYGIAYDFVFLNPITNQRFLPPFIITGALTGQANFTGDNSFARFVAGTSTVQTSTVAQVGTVSPTTLNFGNVSPAINANLRNPQAHTWNFGLQREMLGLVFKATYVGTKGNYLLRSRDINLVASPVAPATSVADETARLAQFTAVQNGLSGGATSRSNRLDGRFNVITFLDNSANSNYHSYQFEVQKRLGSLFLNANWTWAKSIDDGSDALGVLINDSANQQNPRNNRDNRGPSQFDLRHRLVITHSWAVPWLKNADNPFLRHALGGWNFAGFTTFRTGFPVTLDAGPRRGISPIPDIGGGAQVRPNAAGPVQIAWKPSGSAGAPFGRNTDPIQTISAYAAGLGLSQPLLGNFGTLGRNSFYLNGERDFTWNVYKNFDITEGTYFQLRGEFYNTFNNTSFQDVDRNIQSQTFGQYNTVGQDARVIQLGARFVF